MNPIYQLLVDCFNQVADDPGSLPQIPLDRFPTGSDEQELFAAFRGMLERVAESNQQAWKQYETPANSISGSNWEADRRTGALQNRAERQQMEKTLRNPESELRALFAAMHDVVLVFDGGGCCLEVASGNPNMLLPVTGELLGKRLHDIFPRAEADYFLGRIRDALQRGERVEHEYSQNIEGEKRWFAAALSPVDGHRVVMVVREISARKRAEIQLHETEQQYRSIFEATSDGLMIRRLDGTIVEANPAYCAMHGYTRDELIGQSLTILIHPDWLPLFNDRDESFYTGSNQHRVETVNLRKDGTSLPIEIRGTSFTYRGQLHVLAIVRDITERVQAYELLERRVQERTRELSTLQEVSKNIASTLELKPLLELILDQVRAVAAYSRASIAILDGEEMVIAAYQGRFRPQEVVGERLSVAKLGMIWERFKAQQYVLIEDIHGNSPAARTVQQYVGQENVRRLHDIGSAILVPLIARECVIGYLNVAHQQQGYYTEYQATLLMAIAHQVAGAIENARLYQHAQEETRRAAALAKVASSVALGGTLATSLGQVAQTVVEASGAVACSIIITAADQSHIEVFGNIGMPHGYSTALEAIMRSGQKIFSVEHYDEPGPLVVHGFRQRVLSQPSLAPLHPFMEQVSWERMVSLPIIYQERHLGRLNLYYPTDTDPREEELSFLAAVVSQAATAIENARLYVQAQTAAATEERQRLARELHDSVSQALYGIGLGTYAARNLLARNQPGVPEALDYVTSLAAAGLAEMRALIFELRPESLEVEGLVAALTKQAEALRARYRLTVQAELPSEPELPLHIKEVLYRVAQEALHNTVKHAEAQQVNLRLDYSDRAIVLDLSDDGKGFDPSGSFPGHLGLQSMRERVAQLGGTFEILSAPGQGTAVQVQLPYGHGAGWDLPD